MEKPDPRRLPSPICSPCKSVPRENTDKVVWPRLRIPARMLSIKTATMRIVAEIMLHLPLFDVSHGIFQASLLQQVGQCIQQPSAHTTPCPYEMAVDDWSHFGFIQGG